MYMIATNVDGCMLGDYFAETYDDRKQADVKLKFVKRGDPEAKVVEVKEVSNDSKQGNWRNAKGDSKSGDYCSGTVSG